MTDQTEDRFKGTGQFHPDKAWAKIDREAKDRAFDAKHPPKWWHSLAFPWGVALLLLGLAGCVIYLLLWAFSAPFA
ncbi:TPA: hypothetical protein ACGCEE_000254 [Stenotrophomonas maltophilia]|uniref:hypothetical protein n=1 Tax=Stenotrophomonas maltophilia TaxID=40324 RepID=UPI000CF325CA|nr:hypothetical protein [Stenotrophomonas maltophilia]AVH90027.1 hypothetical protein AL480_03945 [Stenotrophomonas maltophilia]